MANKELPADYLERVYAGVLGKIIGVYLGRPFEGWTHTRILSELGEIQGYVHERLGLPLVVTDDDISGTFTFLRALPDYDYTPDLTPAQIGQTWLNYIVENRAILWWGGLGRSTEHTAYLRLKQGIPAPRSGSVAVNGKTVAEQIGAQIFIDGWSMVAPGDPELAADLARRAASVSHDGEAVCAAQVIAAMESLAFVEPRLDTLLDTAVSLIPVDSVIYRLIAKLRELHEREADWRKARDWVDAEYGYHRFGGGVHVVPNHALVILSLLYGEDDFSRTLSIVNTCGWDTDCNSGNAGCLMGIKNGLQGMSSRDWRGPVADRLFLSTADGGRCVSDAVTEAVQIANAGRKLRGLPGLAPKAGARYHFDLPGSLQGMQSLATAPLSTARLDSESTSPARLENVPGHSQRGSRSLKIEIDSLLPGDPARVAAAVFTPPEARNMPGYHLLASPALYPGQTVHLGLQADEGNPLPVACRIFFQYYAGGDRLEYAGGPAELVGPGQAAGLHWKLPDPGGPICRIGVEVSAQQATSARVYLDTLGWEGSPEMRLTRPAWEGEMWQNAWVSSLDAWYSSPDQPFILTQNRGRGLLIQGARDWQGYRVQAWASPALVNTFGLAACVQGVERYYALLLDCKGKACLVKALDGMTVLAEIDFPWELGQAYELCLETLDRRLRAWVNGSLLFELEDTQRPLLIGAVALVCEQGCVHVQEVRLSPIPSAA
jgi:ADP-ribosylglycohydrolase